MKKSCARTPGSAPLGPAPGARRRGWPARVCVAAASARTRVKRFSSFTKAAPSKPVKARIRRSNNSAFSSEIMPALYPLGFLSAITNHLYYLPGSEIRHEDKSTQRPVAASGMKDQSKESDSESEWVNGSE